MSRFFVDKEQVMDDKIIITGDDVKHIAKVLRLRAGEELFVCDKCGTDYHCEISEISSDCVSAKIIEKAENTAEPPIRITLYQGMPKSDKLDYIVQKCVELGVCTIVPVITKRAVSIPRDSEKKVIRWQRIAEEAAKQSGRGSIPEVADVVDFRTALSQMQQSEALNLMPYECEKDSKLREVLAKSDKREINILIGPEGGFDEAEAEAAKKAGVNTVTLGPRILRTETAPLAVCAAVMYELGDW
ncbi:MAG: 16S rRNA (uracil(1498)-N(3))-methyltransferase [Oscillospiraceae bacterium]|nr:16S rRNA (uracil(1498)-N(3))-methyltransferase [Oscillospiraceae bacterium]